MLDVVSEPAGESIGGRCRHCQEELELHQPDAANPDRLLGTCGSCGRWYMLERLGDSRSVLARLPDRVELNQALEAAGVRSA
jgi:hypothetical protein